MLSKLALTFTLIANLYPGRPSWVTEGIGLFQEKIPVTRAFKYDVFQPAIDELCNEDALSSTLNGVLCGENLFDVSVTCNKGNTECTPVGEQYTIASTHKVEKCKQAFGKTIGAGEPAKQDFGYSFILSTTKLPYALGLAFIGVFDQFTDQLSIPVKQPVKIIVNMDAKLNIMEKNLMQSYRINEDTKLYAIRMLELYVEHLFQAKGKEYVENIKYSVEVVEYGLTASVALSVTEFQSGEYRFDWNWCKTEYNNNKNIVTGTQSTNFDNTLYILTGGNVYNLMGSVKRNKGYYELLTQKWRDGKTMISSISAGTMIQSIHSNMLYFGMSNDPSPQRDDYPVEGSDFTCEELKQMKIGGKPGQNGCEQHLSPENAVPKTYPKGGLQDSYSGIGMLSQFNIRPHVCEVTSDPHREVKPHFLDGRVKTYAQGVTIPMLALDDDGALVIPKTKKGDFFNGRVVVNAMEEIIWNRFKTIRKNQ
eukprot:Pgem_evm1s19293